MQANWNWRGGIDAATDRAISSERAEEHIANARQMVLVWLAEALNTKSVLLTEAELRPLADRLLLAAKSIRAAA